MNNLKNQIAGIDDWQILSNSSFVASDVDKFEFSAYLYPIAAK
jgi:hypothetical protein